MSNCYDDVPHSTSYDRVFYSKSMIAFHARRHPIVCVIKGLCGHAKSDVILSSLLSKSMMSCNTRCRLTVSDFQGQVRNATPDIRLCENSKVHDIKLRPTSSGRECCPRAMMAYHARYRHCVCVVQGIDGMPCPTSSDRVYFLRV
uniref:Uncharacterized protein n=1 Tax=Solanum lycopersicum TaxID=4081 RepID=A0A494G8X9_SOLLC